MCTNLNNPEFFTDLRKMADAVQAGLFNRKRTNIMARVKKIAVKADPL